MNYFAFGDFRTDDNLWLGKANIVVGTKSEYATAVRDVEKDSVAGTAGHLISNADTIPNVNITYTMAISEAQPSEWDIPAIVSHFKTLSIVPRGYLKLYDSWIGSNKWRLARLKSFEMVRADKNQTVATFKITFDCKPQIYTAQGDLWQNNTTSTGLTRFENPTRLKDGQNVWRCMIAKPIVSLSVPSWSTARLKFTDIFTGDACVVSVKSSFDASVTYYIDFETLDCYILKNEIKEYRNRDCFVADNIFDYKASGNSGSYTVEVLQNADNVMVKTRFFELQGEYFR